MMILGRGELPIDIIEKGNINRLGRYLVITLSENFLKKEEYWNESAYSKHIGHTETKLKNGSIFP